MYSSLIIKIVQTTDPVMGKENYTRLILKRIGINVAKSITLKISDFFS